TNNPAMRWGTLGAAALAVALFAGCALAQTQVAQDIKVALTGMQETPPVATQARGTGTFVIGTDRTVSGSVTTTGITATMAHIHTGAVGKSGPPIVPLQQKSDNEWVVPTGTKLTEGQYSSFKAGQLYVNVHSAAYPEGEIRAQMLPQEATRASIN
ncbi:MAG TPA: CHRD domain-containing protein, partial [Burkholderiales bacterium]|nr:CHRD domain-containing protein [Burkholderiales bacterium]